MRAYIKQMFHLILRQNSGFSGIFAAAEGLDAWRDLIRPCVVEPAKVIIVSTQGPRKTVRLSWVSSCEGTREEAFAPEG
jgi:hypothetical protein